MHKVLFWFDVEEDADAAGGEEVLDGLLLELVPFKLLVLVLFAPDKWRAGPTATTCIWRSIESSYVVACVLFDVFWLVL
jgi:hypothetical protein